MSRYDEIDLSTVRTVSIHERDNKVSVEQFGRALEWPGASAWLRHVPSILAAENLRQLVAAIQDAKARGRMSLFMHHYREIIVVTISKHQGLNVFKETP